MTDSRDVAVERARAAAWKRMAKKLYASNVDHDVIRMRRRYSALSAKLVAVTAERDEVHQAWSAARAARAAAESAALSVIGLKFSREGKSGVKVEATKNCNVKIGAKPGAGQIILRPHGGKRRGTVESSSTYLSSQVTVTDDYTLITDGKVVRVYAGDVVFGNGTRQVPLFVVDVPSQGFVVIEGEKISWTVSISDSEGAAKIPIDFTVGMVTYTTQQ